MKKIYRLLYSNKFVAMVMLLMQIITFVAMYIWISDYSKVLFGLSTVLSAVLIIFEINRTEESTFKMTWITLIAIIPIFGALFYLFTRAQGVSMNIGDDYKNIQEANKKYWEPMLMFIICRTTVLSSCRDVPKKDRPWTK